MLANNAEISITSIHYETGMDSGSFMTPAQRAICDRKPPERSPHYKPIIPVRPALVDHAAICIGSDFLLSYKLDTPDASIKLRAGQWMALYRNEWQHVRRVDCTCHKMFRLLAL
ncbi:pyruvate dehydrogenase [Aspergillus luchuensis]|uniref:Pyruvate dehydrogenase n=1 Tax=Aspergillus kawachii TaxID=1069201 RepID=A0A146F9K7_ASPKA|nr:pyruvate dehydrogenase [Aspergillus luchuensis]